MDDSSIDLNAKEPRHRRQESEGAFGKGHRDSMVTDIAVGETP